jgi:prevent-host-death family protein
MATVGLRELSHHTSRYLARVRRGQTLEVTDRGRVIALISPVTSDEPHRRRPRVGGYRSDRSLTAEEIDAELASGFGASDRR